MLRVRLMRQPLQTDATSRRERSARESGDLSGPITTVTVHADATSPETGGSDGTASELCVGSPRRSQADEWQQIRPVSGCSRVIVSGNCQGRSSRCERGAV